MERCTLDPAGEAGTPLHGRFLLWECSLRNDLARLRAGKLGVSGELYFRNGETFIDTAAIAHEALNQETPLLAEWYLDGARWKRISELEGFHYYDMDFLTAYYLKLQILERRALFQPEAGAVAYRHVYTRIAEQAGLDVPVEDVIE